MCFIYIFHIYKHNLAYTHFYLFVNHSYFYNILISHSFHKTQLNREFRFFHTQTLCREKPKISTLTKSIMFGP